MNLDHAIERINVQTRAVETVLPARTDPTAFSWSPDGQSVALGALTDTGYELFLMHPDGSDRTSITPDFAPTHVRAPQWSPDGQWIAFLGGEPFDWHLYRIRPDGGDLQRLTESPGDIRDPQYSPDGRWLLFAADYGDGFHLYRMHAGPDGSSPQKLTTNAGGFSPQYAPLQPQARGWFMALMIVGASAVFGSKKWALPF